MTYDCPLLDSLRACDRARLLDRAVPRTIAAGTRLYVAGDPARRAHLLLSGIVKLLGSSPDGRTSVVCLARRGDVLGDVSALDRGPQPLDAVAATRCELLGLDADLLLEVLEANPPAVLQVARAMAARLRWLSDAALERSTSTVPARLAGRLLELGRVLGRPDGAAVELELPLAQEDLGRLAGMCRESACKTLRSFKRQGLLDYRGRRLRILRPDALERIRCAGHRAG